MINGVIIKLTGSKIYRPNYQVDTDYLKYFANNMILSLQVTMVSKGWLN